MAQFDLTVNGEERSVEAESDSALLYILRYQLDLNGPKFGCGLAQCGACTVLVDGKAIRSCQTPVSSVVDHEIVTLEGLGDGDALGVVQQAFIDEQAAQCGFCINGMIMGAQALLNDNPEPSDDEIRRALAGNLCRCGTHTRILRAVKRAASEGVTTS
jgi:nicotinate dehydrogenase subunit A